MLEAAALRIQDVDFDARTVAITETPWHKPKTRASNRVIPVCSEAVEALRFAEENQKVRPTSGELFATRGGDPWTKDGISHRMTDVRRKAAVELKRPRIAAIPCRKLRASFATMAGRLGAPDRVLKHYLGHTATDVLGAHYRRIDMEELQLVSDLIAERKVRLSAKSVRKHSGNILFSTAIGGSEQEPLEG
jgi:integrase